jgi:hypothetical protein
VERPAPLLGVCSPPPVVLKLMEREPLRLLKLIDREGLSGLRGVLPSMLGVQVERRTTGESRVAVT